MLWRGELPTPADAKWLLEHGVRSVLSIQLDAREAFESADPVADAALSVSYFKIRGLDPLQMLSASHLDDRVALFLATVSAAPKPVYVHCRAGVDRIGVLVAAYRVLLEGITPEDAIAEMARFHSPWLPLEERYAIALKTGS